MCVSPSPGCRRLHAVALVGGHAAHRVGAGGGRGAAGTPVTDHQRRLGLCNNRDIVRSKQISLNRMFQTKPLYIIALVDIESPGLGIIWL